MRERLEAELATYAHRRSYALFTGNKARYAHYDALVQEVAAELAAIR